MQLPDAEKANAMSLYKQLKDLGQSLYRHEMLSKNGLTKEANAEIGKINELASLMNLCYNPIKRTEQAQKDIMILTKSSKHHEYCVAGIDCATGKFVRLMSNKDDKMSFVFNDEEYKDIAVTDPDYRDKNEKLARANVVFSLPDGDWSEEHGKYYKFAAKIFKVR